MFAPYEVVEWWIQWKKIDKKIIFTKDWFNIVKEWDTNKLYLEEYPNNNLIDNIQDFKIIEKDKNTTIIKIIITDNEYYILDIKSIEKNKVNKMNRIFDKSENKDWEWKNIIIKKDKIDINYNIYKKDKIEKCTSTYIKWESNMIWKSAWEYTKEEKHIKKRYFKESITQKLFNLFSK